MKNSSIFKKPKPSTLHRQINGTFFETWPIDYIWAEPNRRKQIARLLVTFVIFVKIVTLFTMGFLVFAIPVFISSKDAYPDSYEESRADSIFGRKLWQITDNKRMFNQFHYDFSN